MLLFALSLILAGVAVGLAAVMGTGSAYLQPTYLLMVGSVVGAGGVIGILIALLEKSSLSKRSQRFEALRNAPSQLKWAVSGAQASIPATLVSIPKFTTPAAEVPVTPAPVTPVPVQKAPMTPVPVQKPVLEPVAEPVKEPVAEPVKEPVAEVFVPTTLPEELELPEEVAEEAVPALPAPDEILYLDPEVELVDIKRVLNIWQMTFQENLEHGQIAGWLAPDGTRIDMFEGTRGYPTLEVRGEMAEDLASFLPQDLPIYPELPDLN